VKRIAKRIAKRTAKRIAKRATKSFECLLASESRHGEVESAKGKECREGPLRFWMKNAFPNPGPAKPN
jgi:hypothetical protein